MARRLVVQRQSDLDIQAAALWYEDQLPGLGMRFLSELDEVFERIESNPKQFPQLEGEVRRARPRDKFSLEMLITLEARLGRKVRIEFVV